MLKNMLLCSVFGSVLVFGANACSSNSADKDAMANGGEVSQTDAAISNTETATVKQIAAMKGGAPVPAKRKNLTVADREKFLTAIGLTEAAEDSAFFVENFEKSLGKKVENAAMTFHSLDSGKYLVEIIVGQGMRISTSAYALYQETGANKATAKALRLDEYSVENGKTIKKTVDELVGLPYFDERTKTLEIVAAGRGGGGCGSYAKYKFTNERAETVEARHSECGEDYTTPPEKWGKLTLIADGTSSEEVNDVLHDDDASEFEHIRSEHAGVLKEYLKTKPDLYPAIATDYDRANPELAQNRLESQTNHPYYVAGDFNGDGKEDFAVIFKSLKAQKSFTVAIFNAPFNKNNAQPAFYGKSDYRFVLHYNKKPEAAAKSLYIGSYDSDDGFIIEPNGKGYKVVDLSANMP